MSDGQNLVRRSIGDEPGEVEKLQRQLAAVMESRQDNVECSEYQLLRLDLL